MQGTKEFGEIIWNYLLKRAETDEVIACNLYKDGKSFEGCVNYIINEVRKSGKIGFARQEIFSMAIHYYDEDSLEEVKNAPKGRIVVCEPIDGETCRVSESKKAKPQKREREEVQQLMFEDDETED